MFVYFPSHQAMNIFSINEFSYGVAHRGASIRIPRSCEKDGYGYFEVLIVLGS